jgi:hypothetical protein
MRRNRREYKPPAAQGSYSRRLRLAARGCAAPPDVVSAIGVRAGQIGLRGPSVKSV